MKTLPSIPRQYSNQIPVVIKDRDFAMVARNEILLLVALVVEDQDEAVDCLLHVWYSAFVRQSDLNLLSDRIRGLIQDVYVKIANETAETVLRKPGIGSPSLCLELTREKVGIAAVTIRHFARFDSSTSISDPCSRQDHRERDMVAQSLAH